MRYQDGYPCDSGYRGLSKRLFKGRWFGNYQITIAKKYLGVTRDQIEGAKIYDKAAVKMYGKDAFLNFPHLLNEYLKEIENATI